MGDTTKISWASASWSPWHGCDEVNFPLPDSPTACQNCYAREGAKRNPKTLGLWGDSEEGGTRVVSKSWDKPRKWNKEAESEGKTRSVFPSIMDPFDPFPGLPRDEFFRLCETTPWLRWLLLTKRPQFITSMVPFGWLHDDTDGQSLVFAEWPRNVWIGVTAETRACWDERTMHLRRVGRGQNAPIRFVSVEPQIEDLGQVNLDGIHQIIQGCESGFHVRPFNLDWCRSMRDQCFKAGVAYFLKQIPNAADPRHPITDINLFPEDLRFQQFPKQGEPL